MSEGRKDDGGKARMDLLPAQPLLDIGQVFAFGAEKYNDRNWEGGIVYGRLYAALQRHLHAFWLGEYTDQESGLPHLAHAGCCLLMLTDMGRIHPEMDDRPRTENLPTSTELPAINARAVINCGYCHTDHTLCKAVLGGHEYYCDKIKRWIQVAS